MFSMHKVSYLQKKVFMKALTLNPASKALIKAKFYPFSQNLNQENSTTESNTGLVEESIPENIKPVFDPLFTQIYAYKNAFSRELPEGINKDSTFEENCIPRDVKAQKNKTKNERALDYVMSFKGVTDLALNESLTLVQALNILNTSDHKNLKGVVLDHVLQLDFTSLNKNRILDIIKFGSQFKDCPRKMIDLKSKLLEAKYDLNMKTIKSFELLNNSGKPDISLVVHMIK